MHMCVVMVIEDPSPLINPVGNEDETTYMYMYI